MTLALIPSSIPFYKDENFHDHYLLTSEFNNFSFFPSFQHIKYAIDIEDLRDSRFIENSPEINLDNIEIKYKLILNIIDYGFFMDGHIELPTLTNSGVFENHIECKNNMINSFPEEYSKKYEYLFKEDFSKALDESLDYLFHVRN